MRKPIKRGRLGVLAFWLISSTFSLTSYAGWNGPHHHYHGGYGHGSWGGFGGGGGIYFGGGWGDPNVIINVPAEGYYAPPICENVRICDTYTDECWIERHCA